MVWAFDEFELDVAACELRRRGRAIVLQPRVFDTLRYLIENSARVVSRQELLDTLWKGQQVKPGAVPWCVNHVRRALGQRALDKYPIDTIRGRGYRFVAAVRRQDARESAPPEEVSTRWSRKDGSDGPFVGRGETMGRLVDSLANARAGEGAVVLLTGSQGIGKTRAMAELAAVAHGWDIGVWSGRCIAEGGAPGLYPFICILREALADRTLSAPDRMEAEDLLSRFMPDTAAIADGPPGAETRPDAGRFWLLDRLVRFLRHTAQQRTRVVMLDDLQDADTSSIDVLSWLAPDLARTKLLVVASARSNGSGDPGVALATRIRPLRVFSVSAWHEADVKDYIEGRMGSGVSPEWGPAIYGLAAGNPLFVREAVSLLVDHQRFGVNGDAIVDGLPAVAQEILARRVGTLPADVRSTLELACVIGQEFDLPLLQRVSELGSADLLGRLDAATSARFVRAKLGLERYEFSHALIHAALYDAMPSSRRVELHGEVARSLQSMPQFEPRLYELAYHLHKGLPETGHQRTLSVCRHAGDAAMRSFAYDDAAKFYEWALAAQRYAPVPDPRCSCELLLACAAAHRRASRIAESVMQCARAIDVAMAEGFADLLLDAVGRLRPTVWMAPIPDPFSLRALERALELFPEEAKADRARAYAHLALLPPHASAGGDSQLLGQRAVGLARELGDSEVLLEALGANLYGYSGPDDLDKLLATTEEMLRLATPASAWWSAEAYIGRYLALLQRADLVGAERALESFGQVAHSLRMPEAIWQFESYRALLRFHAGDIDYAEARFNELNDQANRLRITYARFKYAYQKSALRMERRGHPWFAGHPEPLHEADWTWARAIPCYRADRILQLLDSGAAAEARVDFTAIAADGFQSVTHDHGYLYTLSKLALAAVELGDAAQARVLHEKLLPYARYNPVHGWGFFLGSVSYFLGVLARYLDDTAAAVGHFETALGIHRELGYKAQTLRTELALAELSEISPAGGERRSRSSARQVGAAARKLGLVGLAERATLIADGAG